MLAGRVSPWKARVATVSSLARGVCLIWDAGSGLVLGTLALRCLAALIPLGVLFVSQWLIDGVVAAGSGHPLPMARVWGLLAAGLGLAVGGAACARANGFLELRLADEYTRVTSLRIMRHAAAMDLAWLEQPSCADMLERARAQATDRVNLLSSLGLLVQRVVALLALSITLVDHQPWLFVVLLACVLPTLFGESHFARLGYELAHRLTPSRRTLDYLRLVGSSPDSAKEVKTFSLSDYLYRRYDDVARQVALANRRLARRRLGWGLAFTIVGTLGYYAGYAWLILHALEGRITVGTLTLLAGALASANGELQGLFALVSSLEQEALFLNDLLSFLKVRPRVPANGVGIPAPRPIRRGLEVEDVSFRYPGAEAFVLRDVSFAIRPGERVALVGANGGGKTTLVKLLTRLYQPTGGRILLDGVNLAEYRLDDLRREISVIFQDYFRFDMSVRENVAAGDIARLDDDAALWAASRKSGSEEVIAQLAGGLEQMLGRRFEGGVDLSGGQWQSLALARAYLRDAQFLILDEPTASLDAMAEAEVFASFAELTRGRMALLISHRFSTVRMADRILVLRDGSITEEGSHDSLVAAGGQYATLFETQAANYR